MTTTLVVLSLVCTAVSFPVDGWAGAGLGFAGFILGVIAWRRVRRERKQAAR
jgi:hypothetical protein